MKTLKNLVVAFVLAFVLAFIVFTQIKMNQQNAYSVPVWAQVMDSK